jgi:hypothetical protein
MGHPPAGATEAPMVAAPLYILAQSAIPAIQAPLLHFTHLLAIKGTVSRDFRPRFFHQTIPPRAMIQFWRFLNRIVGEYESICETASARESGP